MPPNQRNPNQEMVSLLRQLVAGQRNIERALTRDGRGRRMSGGASPTPQREQPSGKVASQGNGSGSKGQSIGGGAAAGAAGGPAGMAAGALINAIGQIRGVIEGGFKSYSTSIAQSNPLESQRLAEARALAEAEKSVKVAVLEKASSAAALSGNFLGAAKLQAQAGQVQRDFNQNTLEVQASQNAVQALKQPLSELAFATGGTISSEDIKPTLDLLTERNLVVQQQERELLKAAEDRQLEVYNRPEVSRLANIIG